MLRFSQIVPVGRLFLGLILLQTVILFGLNIVPATDHDNPLTQFFSILLMLSLIFINYFAFDGVLNENIIQVIACVGLTGVVAFYGIFQFIVVENLNEVLKTIQLVVVIVFFLIYIYVGWKVYLEFGWRIYKKIGANPHMRSLYRVFQIFLTVLKLDCAMAVILLIMASVFFLDFEDSEVYLNIVALCITFAWALCGWLSIKNENMKQAYFFFVFSIAEPIYILYKIVRFYKDPEDFEDVPVGVITFSGIIAFCLRFALMGFYFSAYKNFNKGFAEQLNAVKRKETSRRKTISIV
eukprot:GCRY01001364.1.p1 GENE.GCRY01001364.1~~GCRY01001364.1.p1  ORF type:complete len:295 (+),score=17.64 GCRY01001364.1:159-1043(+)